MVFYHSKCLKKCGEKKSKLSLPMYICGLMYSISCHYSRLVCDIGKF